MSLDEDIREAERMGDRALATRLRFRSSETALWCMLCHHPFGFEGRGSSLGMAGL